MKKREPHGQVVLCTCSGKAEAEQLAKAILQAKLAACVNCLPAGTSFFWWEDKIDSEQEYLLLIKTWSTHYKALESLIQERHSYELPEIIAVPIENGLEGYLNWIAHSVAPDIHTHS